MTRAYHLSIATISSLAWSLSILFFATSALRSSHAFVVLHPPTTISGTSLTTREVTPTTCPLSFRSLQTVLLATNSKVSKTKSKSKKKAGSNGGAVGGSSTFNRPIGPGRSLSDDELKHHVSARYLQGPGGPLGKKRVMPRSFFADDDGTIMDEEEEGEDEERQDDSIVSYEQQHYLRELNNRPALVLNADYMPLSYLPLSLWSWQDAVKAIFSGKVVVVDVYPEITVRAANIEVPLPSIIALTDYVQHRNQRPAFTRRNVFLRDEYRCQYCNQRFHTADLSLDHVVPRSAGGVLTWDNAVTSCLSCNGRKGSMPVSQLKSVGMKLLREPKCPSQMELAARAARMVPKRVHPTWKPYLGIAERPKTGTETGDEDYIDDRYFEESE